MRKLVVLVGIAFSCAGAHKAAVIPAPNGQANSAPAPAAPAPPALAMHGIDWCGQSYPWSGGPLKSVMLGKDCTASYEEARNDPTGERAAWAWRIESVRYDEHGKTAAVTLEMHQSIGLATATYRRTYRFFLEGRSLAMVGADPVVRVDEPQRAESAP